MGLSYPFLFEQNYPWQGFDMLFNNLLSPNKRHPISNVDVAWLRMDRPSNLMVINGLVVFKQPIDVNLLKNLINDRFLQFDRFKQRAVKVGSNWYWETDPDFDLSRHVVRVALPGAADKRELEEFVSLQTSSPLDPSKPMWNFYVVENYQGGSALVVRIHHCYADGIALIRVLLSMTDTDPLPPPKKRRKELQEYHPGDIWGRVYRPVAQAVAGSMKTYAKIAGIGMGLAYNPARLLSYTANGMEMASEATRLALTSADPKTKFKGKLGASKRVAWAEPLPLPEVKNIGKVLGCSINDVLLATAAGALRAYLIENGEMVDGLDIRATVPVNMRAESQMDKLGNKFGLFMLSLPIGIENPLERVYEVRKRMQDLKGSYQALIAMGLLHIVGMSPDAIEQQFLNLFTSKATAVMSNVPGPKTPIFMAGAEVDELNFWVPQTGDIGMGVSILSYNNRVQFGVVTDQKLVPDPDSIIAHFAAEFEKLLLVTLMQPWDNPPDPAMAEAQLNEWVSLKQEISAV